MNVSCNDQSTNYTSKNSISDSQITLESINEKEEEEESINDYIECVHCKKKNYYKKNEGKKLNGLNIKCFYCLQYFYTTVCPKCKVLHKIPKFIHEGELITCPDKKRCKNQYIQTFCPIKDCEDVCFFTKPKNYTNLPCGVIYNHKSILVFQKISCYFCLRPIVYITKEEHKINRYYEVQKIKCPYTDCGKIFSRIICPKCTAVIIVEMYIMGSRIKCTSCNSIFAKIYCVECGKLNPLEKSYFKYGALDCRYSSCSKTSQIANCLHCWSMNYFKLDEGKNLIQGQPIKCAECEKEFSSVCCPSCHGLNPFPKGDFVFGKLYKCKYKAICSKSFLVVVCPKCFTFSRTNEELEGKKYTCVKCNTLLTNFQCPFCLKSILDINSNFKKGQIMQCPNCSNKFSFCRCYDCKKLIYYKGNNSILGKSVKCNCGKISVNVICPLCDIRISISDQVNDINNGDEVHCPNCDKNFEYDLNDNEIKELNSEENVYYKNLSVMKTLIGEKFNFGNGDIDENYLEKQKIFIEPLLTNSSGISINISQNETMDTTIKQDDSSKSDLNNKLEKKLCIVCHCYEKESIFYPCAHRCSCYRCAVFYFEVFKKCPKCKKEANTIIPKIFE